MTPTPRVTAPLFARLVGMSMLLALAAGPAAAADLSAEVKAELATTPFVYIQSERKTGDWSTPAEIWFFWDQGAVWVGTKPTSWRVKRIGWGRKKARIAVAT